MDKTAVVDRFDRSPEAQDRAPALVAKCQNVISHPWARMIAEKAESGTKADNFVRTNLGWPNEVGREVRALTYLRIRFPEIYQEYEDVSQNPGMRMFTFQEEPVEKLTTVVRKPARLGQNPYGTTLERVPVFAEKSFSFGPATVSSRAPLLLGELAVGAPKYNTYDVTSSSLWDDKSYKRYLKSMGVSSDTFYGIFDDIGSWAHTIRDLEDRELGWDLRFVNAHARSMPEPDKYGRFEIKVATRIYDPYEGFPPKVFRRATLAHVVEVDGFKVCNRVRLLLRRDFGPHKDFSHSKDVLGQMTYERFVILDESNDVTVAVLKTSYDVTKEYEAKLVMKDQERHPRIGIQDFPYLSDDLFKKLLRNPLHHYLDAKEGIAFLSPTLALFQDTHYQFFRVDLERIFGATFLENPPADLLEVFLAK